ncbi:MAG: PAS domain S-box protein, partial [Deltaproteobacteria bacterium]|nr:PAS domain S-box protein [Deltaproteobacteria bacterium]
MEKTYSQSDLQSKNEAMEKIISRNRIEVEFYKKNAEKYRILFDSAADMIVVVDMHGIFVDLNNKFEEESGYTRTEMIGKNVFDCGIVTSPSSEKMAHYLGEMLSGKQWPIIEIEGIHKNGDIVPYELRAVPHKKDGEIVEIHAILRNITKRKQADDELLKHRGKLEELVRERTIEVEKANEDLKKSEEKYRSILENIEEGYFEVDLNGNLTFLNNSLCKLVELS